jgi:hypothetical protein
MTVKFFSEATSKTIRELKILDNAVNRFIQITEPSVNPKTVEKHS